MSKYAITVQGVTKKIKETTVLNDVSVLFEAGKIHGLVGRNGSGKTMLLKCICGFVIPNSGSIAVDGKVVGKDIDVPDNIGIIIETPGFLPNYNGTQNLQLLAAIKKKIGKKQIKEAVTLVGLDANSKKHVGKYSLGMRQRLGIAQAIMENPDILLLDEPMNGLDHQGVDDVRKLLLGIKSIGKTIILACHSREDIEILCDTVHEMDCGTISRTK